ncbi:hypothetical protein MFRU_001g04320 [Monilinia fructicola]|uniref:Inhibitor I9 domain-containing protein n=1 Tax=Monilinia fructicola TaxID=38448 RepID=A0A5M9JWM6_MONFR|nr:hypothetical protein EYC84_005184 [Monilinia fructicola]KAG4035663.1 hypothetical protein MFRU_001g04320 [Monilinia fructicola]
MKLTLFSIFLFLTAGLSAPTPQKAVIVSYPDNTPNDVVQKAMDAIKAAGGIITHEYKLIKGFAAKAPAEVLVTIQSWGNDYHAIVEEDQIVNANS